MIVSVSPPPANKPSTGSNKGDALGTEAVGSLGANNISIPASPLSTPNPVDHVSISIQGTAMKTMNTVTAASVVPNSPPDLPNYQNATGISSQASTPQDQGNAQAYPNPPDIGKNAPAFIRDEGNNKNPAQGLQATLQANNQPAAFTTETGSRTNENENIPGQPTNLLSNTNPNDRASITSLGIATTSALKPLTERSIVTNNPPELLNSPNSPDSNPQDTKEQMPMTYQPTIFQKSPGNTPVYSSPLDVGELTTKAEPSQTPLPKIGHKINTTA